MMHDRYDAITFIRDATWVETFAEGFLNSLVDVKGGGKSNSVALGPSLRYVFCQPFIM